MPRIWQFIVVAATVFAAPVVHAGDELSRLHKINVEKDKAEVLVHIFGSRTPDFTSFTLQEPFRVVVDWAGSAVDGVREKKAYSAGLVREISVQQFESEAEKISRVTIELAKSTDFRFETAGKAVVVRFKNVKDLPKPVPVKEEKKEEKKPEAPPEDPVLAELALQELPEGPLTEPAEPPKPPPPPPKPVIAKKPPPKPVAPKPVAKKSQVVKVAAAAPVKLEKASPRPPEQKPAPAAQKLAASAPAEAPLKVFKPKTEPNAKAKSKAPAAVAQRPQPDEPLKVFKPSPKPAPETKVAAKPEAGPKSDAAKPATTKPAAPKPTAKVAKAQVPAKAPAPAPAKPAAKPVPAKSAPKTARAEVAPRAPTPRPAPAKPRVVKVVHAPATAVSGQDIYEDEYVDDVPRFAVIRTGQKKPSSAQSVAPFPVQRARPAGRAPTRADTPEAPVFGAPTARHAPQTIVESDDKFDAGPRVMNYVGFTQKPKASAVFVRCDGKARYKIERSGTKVTMRLFDTSVSLENNRRALDTSFFDSAVTRVKATPNGTDTLVEIELREVVGLKVKRIGKHIYLYFDKPGA